MDYFKKKHRLPKDIKFKKIANLFTYVRYFSFKPYLNSAYKNYIQLSRGKMRKIKACFVHLL